MENIEENVVTKGAAKGEPLQAPSGAAVEDLGGPTPENYRPDDDSAKLKEGGATLAQVKNVVNQKAAAAEEVEHEEEVVAEEETTTDEVVAEEETTEEEVVSEEETTEEGTEVVAEEETTEEEVIEEINVEEDLKALIEGEDLSEEFQDKARTIFETAIKTKAVEIKEELNEAYATALVEELDEIKSNLTERVDSYLEYVADEWIKENALQVEAGLKTEMTESFLEGMKGLFEEHYVSIPEDKYDVLESMVNKLDEMESKLNEQIERNVALNKRLAESTSDGILSEVSEGLAVTQKEKLASLAESVEFESEVDYREKLVTLRESYFPTVATSAQRDNSENISEESSPSEEKVSGSMANYLSTMQRVIKK